MGWPTMDIVHTQFGLRKVLKNIEFTRVITRFPIALYTYMLLYNQKGLHKVHTQYDVYWCIFYQCQYYIETISFINFSQSHLKLINNKKWWVKKLMGKIPDGYCSDGHSTWWALFLMGTLPYTGSIIGKPLEVTFYFVYQILVKSVSMNCPKLLIWIMSSCYL